MSIKATPGEEEARFRFYEELNDCIPEGIRKVETPFWFSKPRTIKEAIESFGMGLTRKLIQPKMEFFGFFRCSSIYQ